ncbi:MAG: amidohydrolase [Phycisphaerae bacterium]|nr:amidohydrolase [Phycisphaerae bacterium]
MPTATSPPPTSTREADLRSIIKSDLAAITELRHDLHRHPEIMFTEKRTSAAVARELTALKIQHKAGLARGTGVLGFIPATGKGAGAKTVALRADMDALPIHEKTGKAYASQSPGFMHACGHDGHTSMLVGVAKALSKMSERPHNVLLVFQPAEEGGAGGEKMCDEGCLSGKVLGTKADVIYGLHGWPDLPVGVVATRTGPLLAATDEFHITVRGKGGHAAYPHACIDPIVIASHIVTALQTIASRHANPLDSVVCTVGSFHGGEANNVIPDFAELIGTIRTLKAETRKSAETELRRIVTGIAEGLGGKAEIDWRVGYPATFNHPEATERFRRVAREALGAAKVLEREHPTMGGEDFSFYGKHVPACFFFLGLRPESQATYPNLHTPEFDFNDEALPVGIEVMTRLATAPL